MHDVQSTSMPPMSISRKVENRCRELLINMDLQRNKQFFTFLFVLATIKQIFVSPYKLEIYVSPDIKDW